MKDKFVAKGFGKSWGYLLLFSGIFSVLENGYLSDLKIFPKCFWVRLVWGVVWIWCVYLLWIYWCRKKCLLWPFKISFKKSKVFQFHEQSVQRKKCSQNFSKTKTRKVLTQKLSGEHAQKWPEEFVFSQQCYVSLSLQKLFLKFV